MYIVQKKGEKIEQDRETEVSKLRSYDESSKSKDGRPGGEQGMDQVSSCLSFSHITQSAAMEAIFILSRPPLFQMCHHQCF